MHAFLWLYLSAVDICLMCCLRCVETENCFFSMLYALLSWFYRQLHCRFLSVIYTDICVHVTPAYCVCACSRRRKQLTFAGLGISIFGSLQLGHHTGIFLSLTSNIQVQRCHWNLIQCRDWGHRADSCGLTCRWFRSITLLWCSSHLWLLHLFGSLLNRRSNVQIHNRHRWLVHRWNGCHWLLIPLGSWFGGGLSSTSLRADYRASRNCPHIDNDFVTLQNNQYSIVVQYIMVLWMTRKTLPFEGVHATEA